MMLKDLAATENYNKYTWRKTLQIKQKIWLPNDELEYYDYWVGPSICFIISYMFNEDSNNSGIQNSTIEIYYLFTVPSLTRD